MKPIEVFLPKFVDTFPDLKDMEPGIIYISQKYETANHLCACGCGGQTVTPFHRRDTDWTLTWPGDLVTITPSILNTFCPNQAHYHIIESRVKWA